MRSSRIGYATKRSSRKNPTADSNIPKGAEARASFNLIIQSVISFVQRGLELNPSVSDVLLQRYRDGINPDDIMTSNEFGCNVADYLRDFEIALGVRMTLTAASISASWRPAATSQSVLNLLHFLGQRAPQIFLPGHRIPLAFDGEVATLLQDGPEEGGNLTKLLDGMVPKSPGDDTLIIGETSYGHGISPHEIERSPRMPNAGSSARLANLSDLNALIRPWLDKSSTQFPGVFLFPEMRQDGSLIKCTEKSVTLCIDRGRRERHVLCIGQTGSGKTTRWILPLIRSDIADKSGTVIIFDPKGELVPIVRALTLLHRGKEPVILNFRDPSGSIGWNPLATIKSVGEAQEVAYGICHAAEIDTGSGETPFWRNSSIELLGNIIQALIRDPREEPTLARALDIACLPTKELTEFSRRFPDIPGMAKFVEFIQSGSQNADTIQQDLRMRMNPWRDERVASVTAMDEFRVQDLARSPTVLILQLNEEDIDFLRPVTNLFMTSLIRELLIEARRSPGNRLRVPVSIIVEEFASAVGRIWGLDQRLNTIRQRGISLAASVQSLGQIRYQYGNRAPGILAGFSSKIVFPDLTLEDAKEISEEVGVAVYEEVEHAETTMQEQWATEPAETTKTRRPMERALLDPGRIVNSPSHVSFGSAVTVLTPGIPPFQALLPPAFALKDFAEILQVSSKCSGSAPTRVRALMRREGKDPTEMGPKSPMEMMSDRHRREQIETLCRVMGDNHLTSERWQSLTRNWPLVMQLRVLRSAEKIPDGYSIMISAMLEQQHTPERIMRLLASQKKQEPAASR